MIYKKGDILKKRYKIIERIGVGSTAIVYSAIDGVSRKEVALKVSKQDTTVSNNTKRFAQEAELLLRFNNPNILKAFEVFDDDNGSRVIVMELLKGIELNKKLSSATTIPNQEAIEYILQLINALKDLHKIGTMHRDLKPQNAFVTTDGTLKLMDFGIAQVSEDQGFTKVGSVIGTVGYMAPELLTQQTKANTTTEIYALGIMLFKMLAGYLPFSGNSDMDLARNIISGKPTALNEILPNKVNKTLSDIVAKMISKDYVDRYQTLEELEDIFRKYKNGTLKVEESTKKKMSLFRKRRGI